MIAPDEKTFNYLKGRDYAPKGSAFNDALEAWERLPVLWLTIAAQGVRDGTPLVSRSPDGARTRG